MKLLFVISNLNGGGAEKAISKSADLLVRNGHIVHLILLESSYDYSLNPNIRVHELTNKISNNFLYKRLLAWKLKRLHKKLEKEGRFDLTISTLPYCDAIVSLAKISNTYYRIANNLSSEIYKLSKGSERKAKRRLSRYKKIYQGSNTIAVSEGVARDLSDVLKIQSNNSVIYNPFDVKAIRKLAEEPSDFSGKNYILHIGRFSSQKRHDLLLKAFKNSQLDLDLFLMTKENAALTNLIHQHDLKDRVTVIGFHDNPYPIIKNAKFLVMCSDHEGFPNVLVESLICGTKVIATNCPSGVDEILKDKRLIGNLIIPMDDEVALTNAMLAQAKAMPPTNYTDEDFYIFSEEAYLEKIIKLARGQACVAS